MPRYLTELIGTFFFVLTFGLTVLDGAELAPLAVGGAYMALVYGGNRISGGHYNPAVSLAVFMNGGIGVVDTVKYVVFQMAGAIVAGFAIIWLAGDALTFAPGIGITSSQALAAEFLFTFLLVLIFLETTAASGPAETSYFGLAVGVTVFAGMSAVGDISGAALNPAAALGSSIADTVTGGSSIAGVWLYLAGPLIGAAAAAMVSKRLSS